MTAVIYGNWDRMHDGQKAALGKIYSEQEDIIIARLESPEKDSGAAKGMRSYAARKNAVKAYLKKLEGQLKLGRTIAYLDYSDRDDMMADVLNHSFDTVYVGAHKAARMCEGGIIRDMQDTRASASLPAAKLVLVPTVLDDHKLSMSATRVRKREIIAARRALIKPSSLRSSMHGDV
ncbi:MAG: hypothetical protein GY854_02355 [Deltaproteobacteria bacterium]|nr:hypothetical protein [Deltaproteobacteria bacterium]